MTLNSSPQKFETIVQLTNYTDHNIDAVYQNLISHIVFNPDGDVANFEDYITLVDLSFIID